MKRFVCFGLSLLLLLSISFETPVMAKSPLMTFAIMSDTHIGGEKHIDNNSLILKRGLEDIRSYEGSTDALIIAGDLTDKGKASEYENFRRVLSGSPIDEIYLVMGNHDAGRDLTGGYEEAFDKFKKYCSGYGIDSDARVPYYDTWIKGYHFIFLCTEDDTPDKAYISETQLKWFEARLAENAELYKPIFVISHNPLKNTFTRTHKDNENIGPQSDQIKALIEKYPQVIFMSGHVHNGFGYLSQYINEEKGAFVNIPPVIGADYGYEADSVMYYTEVYKDKVVFRARDFGKGVWLDHFDIVVALNRPVYEEFALKETSDYRPRGSYVVGVKSKANVKEFLSNFSYAESLVCEVSDNFIGTGDKLFNKKRKRSIIAIIDGDVDGNGIITTKDYFAVKRAVYNKVGDFKPWGKYAADADNDGCISFYDCLIIKRKFLEV